MSDPIFEAVAAIVADHLPRGMTQRSNEAWGRYIAKALAGASLLRDSSDRPVDDLVSAIRTAAAVRTSSPFDRLRLVFDALDAYDARQSSIAPADPKEPS